MKFDAQERVVLLVLAKLIHIALSEPDSSETATAYPRGREVAKPKRIRRSAADADRLKREIVEARKKTVPVADIAKRHNISTAYIYQLLNR